MWIPQNTERCDPGRVVNMSLVLAMALSQHRIHCWRVSPDCNIRLLIVSR
jgi:hypothetical protein